MYILNPVGSSTSLCTQVDNQIVFGGLKVIAMKGFVGNCVIIRPFNVSNAVDLVARQIFKQKFLQMLLKPNDPPKSATFDRSVAGLTDQWQVDRHRSAGDQCWSV